MNASARELSLIGHERRRERIRAMARRIRSETKQPHDPRLEPVLLLVSSYRTGT